MKKYYLREREERKQKKKKFFFSFFSILRYTVYVCVCVPLYVCLPIICLFIGFSFFLNAQSFLCCCFWLSRYFVTSVRSFIKSALLQHSGKVYYQIVFLFFVCLCLFVHLFKVKYMCPVEKKHTF
jgi:hypothetical protein